MNQLPDGAKRIAFFGGSFDPPHLGHLEVARAAAAALDLDAVLFAPVGTQPLKPKGSTAEFADRVAMTRLAIADDPSFAVSLADAPLPGGRPNYTLDTLKSLRCDLPPGGELFCLIGADSFLGLRRWHGGAEIPFVAPLVVASRPNEPLDRIADALPAGLSIAPASEPCSPAQDSSHKIEIRCHRLSNSRGDAAPFYLLPGVYVEISATQIRRHLRDRASGALPARALVPALVAEYIRTHGLYRK